jgi:(p)ppGpp synthase/HD superfamily hydrolase
VRNQSIDNSCERRNRERCNTPWKFWPWLTKLPKHVEQRRKGEAKEPYVNHLPEVATLVASAGASEDVCAALLHDAIEDQKIPAKVIERLFGATVARLVCEVTDDKAKSKEERKELQITHAPTLSLGAKLNKLGDKISNLNSLASSPLVSNGRQSGGWTTCNGAEWWSQGCAAPTRCWKSGSMRPQRPPERPPAVQALLQ